MTTPLAEAIPSAMDELMSRDPLSLTRDDKLAIVNYYRALRLRHEQAPEPKGRAKAQAKAAAPRPASLDFDE